MGRVIRNLIRHDAADTGFVERVRAAYVSAAEAQRALTGAGAMTDADAARLRMLDRKGLLKGTDGGADAARRHMIQRRERTGE